MGLKGFIFSKTPAVKASSIMINAGANAISIQNEREIQKNSTSSAQYLSVFSTSDKRTFLENSENTNENRSLLVGIIFVTIIMILVLWLLIG